MAHPSLTQQRLKELLHYDPEMGVFTWAQQRQSVAKGRVAGCVGADGYLGIKVEGRRCFSHRLAWLYMTGAWPAQQIDHINRVKTDNRFCNLREASPAENKQNTGLMKTNRSGFSGVSIIKATGKFYASIKVNRRTKRIGDFHSAEEAARAYAAAKARLHSFCPQPASASTQGL